MSERDKYLTEAIGECWHEHDFGTCPSKCPKCGITNRHVDMGEDFHDIIYQGANFSTPDGFFKLWEWVQKQNEWANEFIYIFFEDSWKSGLTNSQFIYHQINPDRFADAVCAYLKENTNVRT